MNFKKISLSVGLVATLALSGSAYCTAKAALKLMPYAPDFKLATVSGHQLSVENTSSHAIVLNTQLSSLQYVDLALSSQKGCTLEKLHSDDPKENVGDRLTLSGSTTCQLSFEPSNANDNTTQHETRLKIWQKGKTGPKYVDIQSLMPLFAAGLYLNNTSDVEMWNGQSWQSVPMPQGFSGQSDISALSFSQAGKYLLMAGLRLGEKDGQTCLIAKYTVGKDVQCLLTTSSGYDDVYSLQSVGSDFVAGVKTTSRQQPYALLYFTSGNTGFKVEPHSLNLEPKTLAVNPDAKSLNDAYLYVGGPAFENGKINEGKYVLASQKNNYQTWLTQSNIRGSFNTLNYGKVNCHKEHSYYGDFTTCSSFLFMGGGFQDVENKGISYMAKTRPGDAANWEKPGEGINQQINVMSYSPYSSGSIYVGGDFDGGGKTSDLKHVARWTAKGWTKLGEGLNQDVYALVALSNGMAYAGGDFDASGNTSGLNHVAMWDGKTWQPLGAGLSVSVKHLAIGAPIVDSISLES